MDKDYIISIQDLLKGWNRNSDFDNVNESRIKLVRHSSDVKPDSFIYNKYKGSVYKLYRTDYALFKYAKTGHGNNKLLVALLVEKGISYADQNFHWTILETLPLNVTPKVAIDRESLYKKKFGTREHGYNEN